MNTFIASPGTAVIEPIQDTDTSLVTTNIKNKGRIKKGKILSIGKSTNATNSSYLMKSEEYGKVGDVIYFLHYFDEGGYDYTTIDGKEYYFVKFEDFRSIVE